MSETKEKKVTKTKSTKEKTLKKEDNKEKTVEVKEEKAKSTRKKPLKEEKKQDEIILSLQDSKNFKTLSRIIAIITKIIRVCLMIFVPIVFLAMILIPIACSNVEIEGNIVKFNDARFVLKDDYITMNIGNRTHLLCDGVKNLDHAVNFLNNNSITSIVIDLEIMLLFNLVVAVIDIYILIYIEKLFMSFVTSKSPFTEENGACINKIGKLMVYSFIVSIVLDLILVLVTKNSLLVNVKTFGIIEILCVFTLYYIFRYGINLEKKN